MRMKFPVNGVEEKDGLSSTHFSQRKESFSETSADLRDYPSSIGNYDKQLKKIKAAGKSVAPARGGKDTYDY